MFTNSLTSSSTIFSLVLKLFYQIFKLFQTSLKYETQLFFANLIRILNSNCTSQSQKISTIKFLSYLFATHNSDLVHTLFLIFDCEVGMLNIVERLITSLATIVQTPKISTDNTSAFALTQTIYMKSIAFKALNQILTCLHTNMKNMQQQEFVNHPACEKLEKQKRDKNTTYEGISLFNENPKKGIEYFVRIGYLPNPSLDKEAFETAFVHLLQTTQGFSKHAIGEYFASPDHEGVLTKFIQLQSFSGMLFEKALRKCLDLFMLPKESQEIHRVLSSFADKFVQDNPQSMDEMFKNPDACYVFTISVVILNSELHNVAVKNIHNTTLEAFIQRNFYTDAATIDHQIQERVFNDLKENEFTLTEDDMSVFESLQPNDDVVVENAEIERVMRGVLKSKCCSIEEDSLFQVSSSTLDHFSISKVLFNCIWPYFNQSFISLFENDQLGAKVHHLVLSALKTALQLCVELGMTVPRNEFFKTLCTFTSLMNNNEKFSLKEKHLVALKTLLSILETNASDILESWSCMMEVFYQVDRILSSINNNNAFIQVSEIDNMTTSFHQHVDQVTIDRIFSNNNEKMDELSIEYYVKALCSIQCKGHTNETQCHIFCINKVIEACYLNLARMDKLWSRTWNVISNFFISVATCKDSTVAMYAVDTLRQLIHKLIEIDSLSYIQQEMLRPFIVIVQQGISSEIQLMVIECIANLALTKPNFITTGWKAWVQVLSVASSSKQTTIVRIAFEKLLTILDQEERRCKYLSYVLHNSCFVDLIYCLKAFVQMNIPSMKEVSLNAISLIQDCANTLVGIEESGNIMTGAPLSTWIPILTCLSSLVSDDAREDIRAGALQTLQALLNDKSIVSMFSAETWRLILHGALLPIFDHLSCGDNGILDEAWIDCTSRSVFKVLVSVLDHNISSDVSFDLFASIMNVIMKCYTLIDTVDQYADMTKVFEVGTDIIQILISTCGGKFEDSHWRKIQKSLEEIVSRQNSHNMNLYMLIHITEGINRILTFLMEHQLFEYFTWFVMILEQMDNRIGNSLISTKPNSQLCSTSKLMIDAETKILSTSLRIFSELFSMQKENVEMEMVQFGITGFINTAKRVFTFYVENQEFAQTNLDQERFVD